MTPRGNFFFFEAQTGIIREKEPFYTNYYQYRLAIKHLEYVQETVAAHDNLCLSDLPLPFSLEFLTWCSRNDQPVRTKA